MPKAADADAERIARIDAALTHLRQTRDETVRLIEHLEKERATPKVKTVRVTFGH